MPDTYEELKEKLQEVHGLLKVVQIDVMDGKFVDSISWPYGDNSHFEEIINQEEGLPLWDSFDFEIDLMVTNPKDEAINWIAAGASRLIFHLESFKENEVLFLDNLKKNNEIEIGISITPQTPNEALKPYLEVADLVQFMGIDKVGYQNQELNSEVYGKIEELRGISEIDISVDGGVNFDNALKLKEAGANILVSGSVMFEDVENSLKKFEDLLGF